MWRTYTNNTDVIRSFIDVHGTPITAGIGETVRYEISVESDAGTLGELTDVDLTSIAAGAVLYRNASDKWVNLPKGALGRVLTLGATIPDWEGVKKLGVGSNITQIATDGLITFAGDARTRRHIRVCAPSWKKGSTAPSESFIGVVPVLEFDAARDDEAHFTLMVPWRIDAGTTVEVMVDWCYTGTQDNGTVCWKVEYIDLITGDTVAGAAATIVKTTAGNHVTGKMVRSLLAPELSGLVAHHALGLKIWRDVSGDTLNTDACLIQVHFMFVEDKLGEPV